jgi:triosephosphate isomerase
MRKKLIAGNWKMNTTPKEAAALAEKIKEAARGADCDVCVCPPFLCLPVVCETLANSNVMVGAQNVHWEKSGAFTGETAAVAILELGAKFTIVGHSERRQYFGETDETVNKRAAAALESGLIPIICVGESLTERELGIMPEVIRRQVKLALSGFSPEFAEKTVIAYEPIWAIGTGKTATADEAQEVCGIIRVLISELFGKVTAEKIRVLYGGSMNAQNAAELLKKSDIDGGLIGGASLKPDEFAKIIKSQR